MVVLKTPIEIGGMRIKDMWGMSSLATFNTYAEMVFRITCAGIFMLGVAMKWLFLFKGGVAGEVTAGKTYDSVSHAEGGLLFILRSIWVVGWPLTIILYAAQPGIVEPFQIQIAPWLRWFGILLGCVGLGFMWWVHSTLGNNYAIELKVKPGHQLVCNGPYALVRHPMYAATVIVALACALIAANLLLVVCAVIAATLYGSRIDYEEAQLLTAFGEPYITYQHTVKHRFIPGIY